MQLSKQSQVRWRRSYGYHCPDGNTHIKNGRSFKKYSKITLTIHINMNSYSFGIMFIMIILQFFIICFINGWKYEKVATNWDRVTNWCVYLRFGNNIYKIWSNIFRSVIFCYLQLNQLSKKLKCLWKYITFCKLNLPIGNILCHDSVVTADSWTAEYREVEVCCSYNAKSN